MNVHDIPHVVAYYLDKYGLAQVGWRFRWDHACRRAGCCRYSRKLITMSKHYVELNIHNYAEVLDTILHELAHALVPPGHGHDYVWKAKCVELGARPERCYDTNQVVMPQGRLAAKCGACGKLFSRHRPPPRGRFAYCRQCGPEAGRLAFAPRAAPPARPAPPTDQSQDNPPPPKKLRGT